MSIFTVDDQGQIIVTPSELDKFEYYRDNTLVRRFRESIDFEYTEIVIEKQWEKIVDSLIPMNVYYDETNDHTYILAYGALDFIFVACVISNKTGSWVPDIIITPLSHADNFGACGITMDSSGYLHVFWMKEAGSNNEKLQYATNKTGSWVAIVLDTAYAAGRNGTIIVDSSGNVHIIYAGKVIGLSSYEIRYINNLSGWQVETIVTTINTNGCKICSAGLKSNGDFEVVYGQGLYGTDIYVATGSWNSWSIINTTYACYTSPTYANFETVLDSNDKIHVFKKHYNDLQELTNATGSWVNTTLFDIGDQYTSKIACWQDKNGYFHLYTVDRTLFVNHYYTNLSGNWIEYAYDPTDEWGGIYEAYRGVYYNGVEASVIYRDTSRSIMARGFFPV